MALHVCHRAVGNRFYGQKYREQILDTVRKQVELCDCLQCFFLLHSMGGGIALKFPCDCR